MLDLPAAPKPPNVFPITRGRRTTSEERAQEREETRSWFRENRDWWDPLPPSLPAHLIEWPKPFRNLARSVLAFPPSLLDPRVLRDHIRFPHARLEAQWTPILGGEFKPGRSKRINPVVLTAVWAFDRSLKTDIPKQIHRTALIVKILKSVYPKAYQSGENSGPPKTWTESLVRDYQNRDPA